MPVDELGCLLVHHHPGLDRRSKIPEQPGGGVTLKDEYNVSLYIYIYSILYFIYIYIHT